MIVLPPTDTPDGPRFAVPGYGGRLRCSGRSPNETAR